MTESPDKPRTPRRRSAAASTAALAPASERKPKPAAPRKKTAAGTTTRKTKATAKKVVSARSHSAIGSGLLTLALVPLRLLWTLARLLFSVGHALTGQFVRLDWRGKLTALLLVVVLATVVIGLGLPMVRRGYVPSGAIAPLFPPSVQYWGRDIARWAAQWELDANLVATLMQIESCGLPSAESYASAQGLFQVMPFHFSEDEKNRMQDPEINAQRGMGVIKDCLERSGYDFGLAMACYNGGPRRIAQPMSDWPAQTQRYYYWGTGIYADARDGKAISPTLNEWLAAGGKSLCVQASVALGVPTPTAEPPDFVPVIATVPPFVPTLESFPVGTPLPVGSPPPDGIPTFDATANAARR